MIGLTLIKVGGAVLEDKKAMKVFLDNAASLPGLKIIVHGGGRAATETARRLGIENSMVAGRRVTGKEMLEVVTMVYGGLVNKAVVAGLQARGVNALGLTGADMKSIISKKRAPVEAERRMVDYGFVGDVEKVDAQALASLLLAGVIPVIAPLTYDGKESLLNTNADTIASSVAVAMAGLRGDSGEKLYDVSLVFCFEKAGVLYNPEDDKSLIKKINKEDFLLLKRDGIVSGGMLPKLENAFKAIEAGVRNVIITDIYNLSGGTSIC